MTAFISQTHMVLFLYMSNIEFDEEQYSQNSFRVPKPSKMASLVISTGLAKDEKGANAVLVGLVLALVVIFFIVVFSGGNEKNTIDEGSPALIDPVL